MSILLDAVNRNKQQQGDVADLMSTPAAHYSSPSRPTSKLNPYSLLAVAIILGIGAAWGMSVLLVPPSPHSKVDLPAGPEIPLSISQPLAQSIQSTPVNKSNDVVSQTNDEIRLAGKVALPIAKPFNQFSSTPATPYANDNNASNGYVNDGYVNDAYTDGSDGSELNEAYSQPSSMVSSNNQENRFNDNDVANRQLQAQQLQAQQQQDQQQQDEQLRARQQEQIILGANANRRGLAELEALRMQVNTAAQEVDFASVKAPSIDERNNLLAAFEVALKDVEFEQSVNQQVTEAKLDPIPRPNNQQIPSYGDLPASVQLQVPEFNINAHVYSSEPNNRWLNVDGVELQQGDMIKNKLTIIEIRPRDIVLDINGEQFRVPAI